MRPLLNAGHDPAEYVAIAHAVGVDPYELLAQAENEVGGRSRRIDLTLCSHPVDGRSRRIPDISDRAGGRRGRANGPSAARAGDAIEHERRFFGVRLTGGAAGMFARSSPTNRRGAADGAGVGPK